MCKRILSIVTALLILIPFTALNCLALENKSAGQTEYKVTVLPDSQKYSHHRTDGRFFYSEIYPKHTATYKGTGASIYNVKGEVIVPPQEGYYFVNSDSVYSDGLICMKKFIESEEKNGYTYLYNPMYGYLDEQGNVAIDFAYEMTQDFSCGLGVVKKDGKYGCIDRYGNVVIDFLYDNIYPFEDGYTQALLNDEFVTLDVNGTVTKGKFDEYRYRSPFVNGYAFVRHAPVFYNGYYKTLEDVNGYLRYNDEGIRGNGSLLLEEESGYGFIDEDGNVIYDFVLDADIQKRYYGGGQDTKTAYVFNASQFTQEGIAVVKQNGKYGVIDTEGNLICDFVYDSCEAIGKFIICAIGKEEMLLDKYGDLIFDLGEYRSYKGIGSVSDYFLTGIWYPNVTSSYKGVGNVSDYILVQSGDKWGVFDIDGTFTLQCDYDQIEPNANGDSLKVKKDGKYGVSTLDGELLVPLEFSAVKTYDTSTAIVKHKDTYRIYFIQENKLSDFSFEEIEALQNDSRDSFWAVKQSGRWGVIDINGDWVLEPEYAGISGNMERVRAICHDESLGYYDKYFDNDFNLIFYYKDGKTYDSQDREIYSFELRFWNNERIDVFNDIYRFGSIYDEHHGIVAINKIPKPPMDVSENYICLMFNNPLLNVGGNIYPMEENNYYMKPLIENDRTLVPLRALSEAMGASTQWEEENQLITIENSGTIITLQIDRNEMYINGTLIWLDVPARLSGDRTFVPLRAISEGFGAAVDWFEPLKTITISY